MRRKKFSQKAGRVVRKRLSDGTKVEYHYAAWSSKAARHAPDTVGALSIAWRVSPEWAALAPASRVQYTLYLRELDAIAAAPLADIKRRDIMTLRDSIAATRGNGAAGNFMRTVGAAFAWARSRGWIEHSPCHKIPPLPSGTLPAWTEAQLAHAMAHLPEPLRRVVVLGAHTGQRRGDLCAMPWGAYDGAVLRFTQQKTRQRMEIPAHPALRAELAAWRTSATSTLILTTEQGLPWRPNYLSEVMSAALRQIGLPAGLNVHGLRKLAATRLAEAGCSAHEIAAVTGHKTLQMVQHYTESADQGKLAQAAIVRLRTKETG